MAQVEVRDRVIWTRHIHGDPALVRRLDAMAAGQSIQMKTGGKEGTWVKMRDRPNGSPTPGLRPVGPVSEYWRRLFAKRRGALVDLNVPPSIDEPTGAPIYYPDPAKRQAALKAILELAKRGWRSEEPYGSRDELYDDILARHD